MEDLSLKYDEETIKRRLREMESQRDNILHQLVGIVKKIDEYKEILKEIEWDKRTKCVEK